MAAGAAAAEEAAADSLHKCFADMFKSCESCLWIWTAADKRWWERKVPEMKL